MRSRQLIPRREDFCGAEPECTAQIDDAHAGLEESWSDFRGYFMRRSEKRNAGVALRDGTNGKLAQGGFPEAPKLGKQLAEAVGAIGLADVEGWTGHLGMAQ